MTEKLENKNCYLYVLNTLADWEIGFLTAELNSQRYLDKHVKFQLITIGPHLKPIKTMGGMLITPEKCLEEIKFKTGDLLILPGADTWLEKDNEKILSMLPELLEQGVIIAAICGATTGLAQSGLLDNRKHTSNDKEYLKMFCPNYKGSSLYSEEPVAIDNNLITATGLAPLEFSYEIFKKIKAMTSDTLEAWYQLYRTKESKYFFSLMESIK